MKFWSNRGAQGTQTSVKSTCRHTAIESLESRQFLSASELVDSIRSAVVDSGGLTQSSQLSQPVQFTTLAVAPKPSLPLVRRNYLGIAVNKAKVQTALVFKIRKQDSRGSLRGEVRIAPTRPISIYITSITYGKVRANHAITLKFSGNGLSGTVTGKVNDSGSQITGTYSITGQYTDKGTFKVKKNTTMG